MTRKALSATASSDPASTAAMPPDVSRSNSETDERQTTPGTRRLSRRVSAAQDSQEMQYLATHIVRHSYE